MSHKSRLCAVLFDVDAASHADVTQFWAAALGRDVVMNSDGRYADMAGEIEVSVQKAEPGREGVHVDIETDDIEAEVARLEKLGAKKRAFVKRWWVMEAPGGQVFCVVEARGESWPTGAVEWN